MNKPLKPEHLKPERQTTTIFTSGNSQAVRLPKAFRFSGKTVEISRRGDEVVLKAHRPALAEVLAELPPLTKEEAAQWDDVMRSVREGQGVLEERDWSWMDDEGVSASPPVKKSPAGKKTGAATGKGTKSQTGRTRSV